MDISISAMWLIDFIIITIIALPAVILLSVILCIIILNLNERICSLLPFSCDDDYYLYEKPTFDNIHHTKKHKIYRNEIKMFNVSLVVVPVPDHLNPKLRVLVLLLYVLLPRITRNIALNLNIVILVNPVLSSVIARI